MKKSFKILSLILAFMLTVVCFAGCKDKSDDSDSGEKSVSGYEAAIKKYIKAIENVDGETLIEFMLEPMLESGINESGSESDIIDELESSLTSKLENFKDECGENIKISYDAEDVKKYDKEKLEEIKEEFEKECIKYNVTYDDDSITEAAGGEIELTIKGDDGKITESIYISLFKENGKWKVYEFRI